MICELALPKFLAEANLKVNSLNRIGAGDDSEVYLCNKEYIIKVPKREKVKETQDKEFALYDFLSRCNLPFETPKPILSGENFKVTTYIKGQHLSYDDYQSLSEKEKNLLAMDEANFLKALHSISIDLRNPLFKGRVQDKKQEYLKDKEKLANILREMNLLNDKVKELISSIYSKLFSSDFLFNYSPCLVHNDFSSRNMVFNNSRLVGVIDFGDFLVGDPDNDFLCLLDSSTDDFGKEFGRKVLKFYGHPQPLLAEKKAEINDSYWPIQQIILGDERDDSEMLKMGIKELLAIK
ncbi:aminoglycoside 2''-phosphotransferase [Clostridium punense]|uniref:Aminoglycoside 2''-phosphotransferase n=1 Tax=Clostridium punense TaxID=1054297 RepID=A0ABS4K8U6_9CLOT|nr:MULTISPECIES: aminoglycoside phosphotransferase family protein [Clostridium]EQB88938.1 hypothetical protein M918_22570 [Clostridium sp. BL8]MBP2024209.1 aminoglycoside 2''-phosphotransferase [Clostridium punense]